MNGLYLNGKHASDLGLRLAERGSPYARSPLDRGRVGVPGVYGAHLSRLALGDARTVTLRWNLPATTENRRTQADTILQWLAGLIEIEWEGSSDRIQWAVVDVAEIRDRFNALLSGVHGDLEVPIELVIPQAVSIAKEPTILELPADTVVQLPLGTATSAPQIYLPEGSADALIEYRRGDGELDGRSFLQVDGTVPTGYTLRIDLGWRTVVTIDSSDGTETSAPDYLDESLTDGEPTFGSWFVLDGGHAKGESQPTLKSSEAAWCIYWRTWE